MHYNDTERFEILSFVGIPEGGPISSKIPQNVYYNSKLSKSSPISKKAQDPIP